jgi:hypothetical protein
MKSPGVPMKSAESYSMVWNGIAQVKEGNPAFAK